MEEVPSFRSFITTGISVTFFPIRRIAITLSGSG